MKSLIVMIALFFGYSQSEEFDHSKFYQTKAEIQKALVKSISENSKYSNTVDGQTMIQLDLMVRLLGLQSQGLDFKYDMQAHKNDFGDFFIILKPSYEDSKGKIAWEFVAVTDGYRGSFYTRIDNGKPSTSPEDYYRFESFDFSETSNVD